MSAYPSVALVSNREMNTIGTGFVIHKNEQFVFLLTCAHVVEQIESDVIYAMHQPAEVLLSGKERGIDLALLKIEKHPETDFLSLSLSATGNVGLSITAFGFSHLTIGDPIGREIEGYLHRQFTIPAEAGGPEGIVGWDVEVDGHDVLANGYSGAPVFDRSSRNVLAIITAMQDDGKRGYAISIEAFTKMLSAAVTANTPDLIELAKLPIERANTLTEVPSTPGIADLEKIEFEPQPEQRIPSPEPPQWLMQAITEKRVVPFIGAGLSIAASTDLPDLSKLIDMLAERLPLKEEDREDIQDFLRKGRIVRALAILNEAQIPEQVRYRELRAVLNPVVGEEVTFSPPHTFLNMLDFNLYITTNYDRLLEQFLFPQPEVITSADTETLNYLLNEVNISGRYILKLHGDISRPETILASESLMSEIGTRGDRPLSKGAQVLTDFLGRIFKSSTVLFLGSSVSDREGFYRLSEQLAQKWGTPKQIHLALVPHEPSRSDLRSRLSERLGIRFIEYHPDQVHSQVWEFISFLNTIKKPDPEPGKRWSQFYRSRQRHEYLERQLILEQTARSVRFLTPGLSNALATYDYLDYSCRRSLKSKIRDEDRVEAEQFIDDQVIPFMVERWRNIEHRLRKEGLEVQALCLQTEVDKSFKQTDNDPRAREILIDRYLAVLTLTEKTDFEIRLIPKLTSNQLKDLTASYALIYSNEPIPFVDVAIAEASQATMNFFEIHMLQIGTAEVYDKIVQFEQMWASSLSEKESTAYLKQLIDRHS